MRLPDALTVVALFLMAIGLGTSLTIGASFLGLGFPLGAAFLVVAHHLSRRAAITQDVE
jgi:hypothetical protein